MSGLKAIPTRYAGHFFRSRGEARFAVFLDSLGVKWEFEVEGYRLPVVGNYLPDFWLPDMKAWVEIKGTDPSAVERRKARSLAEESDSPVYVFFGGMGDPSFQRDPLRAIDGARALGYGVPWLDTKEDGVPCAWVECPRCGAVTIVRYTTKGSANTRPCSCRGGSVSPVGQYLKAAYQAARSARFEYGDYNRRAPRIRPVLRTPQTFTPAKAPVGVNRGKRDEPQQSRWTFDFQELRRRWPALRDELWPSFIDRATFHSCELVGLEGTRLVIQMSSGNLMLLKDEKKRTVRGDLIRLLGKGADVRFIDNKTPYPPVSKWDGLGVGHTVAHLDRKTDGDGE